MEARCTYTSRNITIFIYIYIYVYIKVYRDRIIYMIIFIYVSTHQLLGDSKEPIRHVGG